MNTVFNRARWVWCTTDPQPDEYGEFIDQFQYEAGVVLLRISADSNYAVYVNGELATWGQYADFPYYKVYDEVDITAYCKIGVNRLAIIVWYYGIETTQVYYPGKAGLLYEALCEERVLCVSDEHTLARMSRSYINHKCKIITEQLGFSYEYDATREDSWTNQEAPFFRKAVVVEQKLPLHVRPCKKLEMLPSVKGREHKKIDSTDVIYDLDRECVGFLSFTMESPKQQKIIISYGEHLADGCVRQVIGERDFSVVYQAKEGRNVFVNPFRRLGCRYLEVRSESAVEILELGIIPVVYPVTGQKRPTLSVLHNKIYDMCVETLHLCMHEHYEDCPWREQALYTMDSRNQMLCGYYAFAEYEFPRSNLQLISKDDRKDGLLSICYPMIADFVIPSFSLYYIIACREYLDYSKDKMFLKSIYPKLCSIVEAFLGRMRCGLVWNFVGENYWNFYEWREGLNGFGAKSSEERADLILNALLSLALQNMELIAEQIGENNSYSNYREEINRNMKKLFWDEKAGFFYNTEQHDSYSQMGNGLAVLCGLVEGKEAEGLCEKIRLDCNMTPISMSMLWIKYDAWLKANQEYYAPLVLSDIEQLYYPMVEAGSTTVWETEEGEKDFNQAGSLCHGWSALPIYYFHILEKYSSRDLH